MTEAALLLDGVTKRYPRSTAGVADLSFEVAPGQVFGFLGPNGAGKTTTIRLVLDLLRPDRGTVRILGLDAHRRSVDAHRRLGYVPGELALWDRFDGRTVLAHLARLRGGIAASTLERLVDRFDVELDRPLRTLSKGNKQKIGLVQALMGDPEVLILDEPTSGLDPLVQKQVHDELRERALGGTAVFLSSHVLGEVAAVADRVGIIREGRLIAVDDVSTLRNRAVHRVSARFATPPPPDAFGAVTGVRRVHLDGASLRLELTGSVDPVVKALAAFEVVDLEVAEPSLEDVFLSLYEAPTDGEASP